MSTITRKNNNGSEMQESISGKKTYGKHTPNLRLPRVVSLFSGAGGLDLGFYQQGFEIAVAIDSCKASIATHQRNFLDTKGIVDDLTLIGPEGVLRHVASVVPKGERIAIIGGPPCQGFSRGNSNSRSDDPRNGLTTLYIKIVEFIQQNYIVDFVLFENVLGIKQQKHLRTYNALLDDLEGIGFDVTERVLCALDYGVPQTRKRVILTAMSKSRAVYPPIPRKRSGPKNVEDAIFGLADPVFYSRGLYPETFPEHPNHWTMQPKSKRFLNPVEDATGRSFRRLNWTSPSPTIAFGNREIYVHPDGKRRLSIYEAMLLQGFPKNFVLEGNLSEQVRQVSNAVPPPMAASVAQSVKLALSKN